MPTVDGHSSQEHGGTYYMQGEVPLGESNDQSCSSTAPTVHMTGPMPPWSAQGYPGMQTMGWPGGVTPGPMPGSPFPPWGSLGMPAPLNGYADMATMGPNAHLQQIAFMQYQLSMMQQAMTGLAPPMPLSPGMPYGRPGISPSMSGYPVPPIQRYSRPHQPDRFGSKLREETKQPQERVPFGEAASYPLAPKTNERLRSFQPSDNGDSDSSQGSDAECASEGDSDSDSDESLKESQTIGGSDKRASNGANAVQGDAMAEVVACLTGSLSTIAQAAEKQLLPVGPPPPSQAMMDTDSTGKFQPYLVVLAKRAYEAYIQEITGKFRVMPVKLPARMTPRLATKVVQELLKQTAADYRLKRQLQGHLGKHTTLTEGSLNLIPDTFIARAFEGMSSLSDMSKFAEEVSKLVTHLAENPVPGIQISSSQSMAARGTADWMADVAANYQQWHQLLWSLFVMMTARTPEQHIPPLLSRKAEFPAYAFMTQLMDYFGQKQGPWRKQMEAVIGVGLRAFQKECRERGHTPTAHEYQEKIRSLAMDKFAEDVADVDKAERKVRDANRSKFVDPSERSKNLQSMTPSPARRSIGWGGGFQTPTRGGMGSAVQSLNAACTAYSNEDDEDAWENAQYLTPMQQQHDGQRGQQWESRGNRDYNGGGRGYSASRQPGGGRASSASYNTHSGYSMAGRSTVLAKTDEGCFLEMRVAVSKGIKPSGTCTNRACQYKHGEETWSHRCANDAVSILGSEHCGFGHSEQDSKAKMLKAMGFLSERPDISFERVVLNCRAAIAAVEEFRASKQPKAPAATLQSTRDQGEADQREPCAGSAPPRRTRHGTQANSVAFSDERHDEDDEEQAEIDSSVHFGSGRG